MLRTIKRYLKLKNYSIDLILLAFITTILGAIGGLPLDIQDSILVPALNAARRLGNPVYFSSPGFVIYIFMAVYMTIFVLLFLTNRVHSSAEFRTLFETNTLIKYPINIPFQLPGHIIIILFSRS